MCVNLRFAWNFIYDLSTWDHNEFRHNEMIDRFWEKFNVKTFEHFYHNGGCIENRRSMVEALVYNFPNKP